MDLRLSPIGREQHLAFVESLPSASHTQVPSWGEVKPDWRAESLGWSDAGGRLVGTALVLYRPLPGIRRSLAYLPEGPVIDWYDEDLGRWLTPLIGHLRQRGAFTVKMGPPVIARRWDAATVKDAIADPGTHRLGEVPPTEQDPRATALTDRLRAMGWQRSGGDREDGFAAGQPRHVFQLPLAGRSLDEIRDDFNQLWRRNIKKAEKAGVKVVRGDYADLDTFYSLYTETAARDRFVPRPLPYFQRMWKALTAEHPDRMRLYLAAHDGDVLAAATMLTVGGHVWYSYGASTGRRREVQPNNAIQWQMIRDAHAMGAHVYDFRGTTDTLDESNHLLGLLRFKVGTGGQAAEYVGEWDHPLNKVLHKAFTLYLARR
ncbi:peptidoglycan bridge formation glycyltransferase FemA/FemB family protein [Streptomyces sp. OfavH-34-F]|uniref:lipid II:glycine glycyltransferase FemX n=1 Tax=Streptomyces sp. OfavH-34-F TaxID=2917760 RepID=UPI001EF18DD4|nr:peptidoglycan bridge formation glycyltransferase FemA/FemB family protein [Streptomyces sp. OfavH-34-F]MCG7524701.1 peptidoglycan bridge formation glycyltransferase FemA/FemB family protein [Streptomyces sp. OfavH-34-F]